MQEYYFKETYYRTNDFKQDRLTLVFIHGVSGSSSAWWPYEKIFENNDQHKYNILTYDLRGHGMSKKFPNYSDYAVKNFAYDLHDLVTYLNISKFVLITNSFGTLVGLEYIKLWRETVLANIFTSPEIYLNKGFKAKIMRTIFGTLADLASLLPFNPKPRGHVDYSKHIGATDWDIKRNLADIRNTGLHADFYTLRQSLNLNQEYFLEKINVPTLIIHGEKDSMVPIKNAFRMSKEIKNSEFRNIPNIDHNTAHNAVTEMSQAIESFIEKIKI
jgi:pimeloyl-ACP methyl ester carboxylesterase